MSLAERKRRFELPHIYVILLGLILMASLLTWVVPAGRYERLGLPDGRESVVAGSYRGIPATPVGIRTLVTSIPVGLSEASSVVFLTLLVGGSVGVVRRTGVIDLGIARLVGALGDRVELTIPALMVVFGLVAAFIGTPELAIAYLPIVLPLMLRLGYDTMTATALVLFSTSLGYAFGITAPSTIGLGHVLAELPMFSGAWFRAISLVVIQLFSIIFVMRHARRVRGEPEREPQPGKITFSSRQRAAGIVALVVFTVFMGLVLERGLGLSEISGSFVFMAALVSVVAGHGAGQICQHFNEAFGEMLTGALIVGVARGVSVVLEAGNILDTLVFHLVGAVSSLPASLTAVGILIAQTLFNFLVPSGSGQCLITLPILLPLGDLIGLTRQVVVLATHWGDGITNILFPTSGYFMATLAIARVSFVSWVRFYFPFFWVVLGTAVVGLAIAQAISLGPF